MTRKFFLYFLLFLLMFSCATTGEKVASGEAKQDELSQKEDKKNDPKKQNVKLVKSGEQEGKKDPKKALPKENRDPNYSGLKYTGPAKEDFLAGKNRYLSDGCSAASKSWLVAFKKDPQNAKIAFNLGVCSERAGNFDEAKNWYEKAYLLNPDFMEPLYNLVLSYSSEIKDKESYFLEMAEKNRDSVEKNNFIAWLYLQVGKFDLAEKHAKMVLKEDEQNSEAVVSLASSYFNNKMYELAESALDTAEKWDPENFKLHRLYGFLLYQTGDAKNATIHLQKAIKSNPDSFEVRNLLAILAMEIEDYATAKEHLEFALKIKADFLSAKINLALAFKGLEEYQKAKELLDEIEKVENLSLDMKKSLVFNKALLYLDADVEGDKSTKRFEIAAQYFNDYLKLIPKDEHYKKEKELVDGYIKEAASEKKKLEFILAAKAKAEKKKKAQEEEHKLFLKQKEEAFKNAEKEDKIEVWEKYLNDFPILDGNDALSNAAQKRVDELKKLSNKNGPLPAPNNKESEGDGVSNKPEALPESDVSQTDEALGEDKNSVPEDKGGTVPDDKNSSGTPEQNSKPAK